MNLKLFHTIKKNRSFFFYLIFALVPLILITAFVIQMAASILEKNSKDMITYQSQRISEILNEETETIFDVFYNAITDSELRSLCIQFRNQKNIEYTTSQLNSKLKFYMSLNSNISECLFISHDYRYTTVQRYAPAYSEDARWTNTQEVKSVFDEISKTDSILLFSPEKLNETYDSSPVFYVSFPICSNNRKTMYGALVLGIQKSYFKSAFFHSDSSKEQDFPEVLKLAQLLFVDEDKKVVYANDLSMVGNSLESYQKKYHLTEENYILSQYKMNKTNWTFLSYCPKNIAFQSVTAGKRLIYTLIALFSIFLFYVSLVIISHQNRKIKIIAEGIREFNGNEKAYHIPLFSNENLNIIITQFNLMADRILKLTESLKAARQKTREEMDLRRKAEIKALESQINPHFLYNTLDTINWLAISKNEMEISSMLGSLGSLLRYSVTNIDAPVLVKAEIEWLKKYLFLQEKRFHSLFTYEILTEPGVENLAIYKLLLQPLIENSIVHGFEDISEGGHILIKICTERDFLCIVIEDNGCGLPPEKLSQLQLLAKKPDSYSGDNIGFFNVLGRLHAYYKDQFYFEISSENGVRIKILVPQRGC